LFTPDGFSSFDNLKKKKEKKFPFRSTEFRVCSNFCAKTTLRVIIGSEEMADGKRLKKHIVL